MNTINRIVWNAAIGKWIVAAKLAKGSQKKFNSLLSVIIWMGLIFSAGTGTAAAQSTTTVLGDNTVATCGTPAAGALLNPAWTGANLCGTAIGNSAQGIQGGTAIGDHAVTSGQYGVALGSYSLAGSHATAVGPSALATGTDSFAGSVNASAVGTSSVAIGSGAAANSIANVAIGQGANTTGFNSVSMGFNATANGNFALSLGGGSAASNARATAVGTDTAASGASATAVGNTAKAVGDSSVALGNAATATGTSSMALGNTATANGGNSAAFGTGAMAGAAGDTTRQFQLALGSQSSALADRSIAIGPGANIDANAQYGIAIGRVASVTATGVNSVALGQGSVADRANTISVGAVGAERQIVNVAAGVANTDAVNISQLKPVVDGLGGGAAIDPVTGAVTGPTYNVGGTDVHNVGDAISNIDGRVTSNTTNITHLGDRVTVNEGDITNLKNGTIGLVTQANATAPVNVATSSGGAIVNVAGTDGDRQLKGVAAGSADNDAVNLSQLKGTAQSVAGALGGGVTVNTDGSITRPAYTVQGVSHDNVGDALGAVDTSLTSIDGRVTKNEGDITNLGNRVTVNEGDITNLKNGTVGMVQQSAAGANLTVGKDTDGAAVDFADNNGNARTLSNIKAGVADADAVNVSQLKAAGLIGDSGDIANVVIYDGADKGTITLGGTGGTTITNVKDGALSDTSTDAVNGSQLNTTNQNVAHLGDRVTVNEGDITNLKNGTIGLVQQAGASAAVTVAAATGGAIVNFTGTTGTRQLKGVSEGLDGTDAVNVTQLNNAIDGVSAGNSRYFKANGLDDGTDDATVTGANAVAAGAHAQSLSDQAVAIGDGAEVGTGSTGGVAIGASARSLQGGTAVGANALADGVNAVALGQGAIVAPLAAHSVAVGDGSHSTAQNAVALGSGSLADRDNTVSVGSAGNERQIVNVADGTQDTDAVNVRQLKSTGLIGDDGSLLDAVVYDAGSNRSSITLGGVAGTTITNVMAGLVAPGSMDAINGSQLWGVQDQINKLGDRVTTIENGTVTPPPSGNPHFASSGDAARPATASGASSVAAGEGAAASGNNSTAIGAGSSATGNNSVAIGAGSVADGDNTVSVGSVGNERRVTNVAAGTQRTDAANVGQLQDAMSNLQDWTQGQVNGLSKKVDNVERQANRGIAASAALVNNMPYLPGKVTLNAGVAAYRGQSALGVGVSRWNDSGRFNVNAGISAAQGDAPIFRVGVGVVLGD